MKVNTRAPRPIPSDGVPLEMEQLDLAAAVALAETEDAAWDALPSAYVPVRAEAGSPAVAVSVQAHGLRPSLPGPLNQSSPTLLHSALRAAHTLATMDAELSRTRHAIDKGWRYVDECGTSPKALDRLYDPYLEHFRAQVAKDDMLRSPGVNRRYRLVEIVSALIAELHPEDEKGWTIKLVEHSGSNRTDELLIASLESLLLHAVHNKFGVPS